MSTRLIFSRAISLIPASEHIASRSFVLYDGSLYFQGDRSWFVIRNFMRSDTNVRISYRHLQTIINLSGTVSASKDTDYTTMFTNGKAKLTVGTTVEEECPRQEVPEDEEFHEPGDVFLNSRNIFSLMNKHSIVSASVVGGYGCVTLASSTLIACAIGDLNVEMDLTNIDTIIRAAVSCKALMFTDRTLMYFKVDGGDNGTMTYVGQRYSRVNMTDKAKDLITQINTGALEQVTEETGVRLTLRAEDMVEVHNVVEKMNYGGHVSYAVDKNKMVISAEDEYRVLFENPVPCVSTGEAMFKTRLLGRSILEFLLAASGMKKGDAEAAFSIVINWTRNCMIVRPLNAAEGKGGFVFLGVAQRTVTGDRR